MSMVAISWLMIVVMVKSVDEDNQSNSFKITHLKNQTTVESSNLTDKTQAVESISYTSQASASTTSNLVIPAISSEQERVSTLAQRKEGLPVFLKIAEQSIAEQQQKIAQAKKQGANLSDIAALESRLAQMQQAKIQVLARNKDITEESAKL